MQTVGAGVWDADDDRLEPFFGQRLERLVDAPLAGETRRLVEQVLPVVHVESRVGPIGRGVGSR